MTPDECVNYLDSIGQKPAADALRRRAASMEGALRVYEAWVERLAEDIITPTPSVAEQKRVRARVLAEEEGE